MIGVFFSEFIYMKVYTSTKSNCASYCFVLHMHLESRVPKVNIYHEL